jgi:hypothetical protein
VTIVIRLLKIISVKQDDERKAYDHKRVPTQDPWISHESIVKLLNTVNQLNFNRLNSSELAPGLPQGRA